MICHFEDDREVDEEIDYNTDMNYWRSKSSDE